jgi:hypothetical protein
MINKKAQISLEIIIVLGILVLGALFFGITYLGNIEKRAANLDDLDGIFDDWEEFDYPGFEYPNIIDAEEGTEIWHFFTNIEGTPEKNQYRESDFISFNLETEAGAEQILEDQLDNFPNHDVDQNIYNFSGRAMVKKITVEIKDEFDQWISAHTTCTISDDFELETETAASGEEIGWFVPKIDNKILINSWKGDADPRKYTKDLENILKCTEGEYRLQFETEFITIGMGEGNDFKETDLEPWDSNYYEAWPGSQTEHVSDIDNPNAKFNVVPDDEEPVALTIEITNPENASAFLEDDTIQLEAISNKENVECDWFIEETHITNINKSCNLNLNLRNYSITSGEYNLKVFATLTTVGEGRPGEQARDSIKITIFKNEPLYLLKPGLQYVNEEFDLIFAGTNMLLVENVSESDFSFNNTSCVLDSPSFSLGRETINVNGINMYFKSIPTTCSVANYSAPDVLAPVSVQLDSVEEYFFVSYDLSLNFAACSTGVSEYGSLETCVLQTSGGSYNDDYWNSDNGLLKITIDVADGKIKNDYGELKVYIE